MKTISGLLLAFGILFISSCSSCNTTENDASIEQSILEEDPREVESVEEEEQPNETEPAGEVEPKGEVEPEGEVE